jgi:hypothetical protein
MNKFVPKRGDYCILHGNKVLYVGKASGDSPYVFENAKGRLERFDSLKHFEEINEEFEEIARVCLKDVKVSNCETMPEAIKLLFDAGMLKLPDKD